MIAKSNIITVSCSRESVKNNGKIYDKRVKNSAVINNKIKSVMIKNRVNNDKINDVGKCVEGNCAR